MKPGPLIGGVAILAVAVIIVFDSGDEAQTGLADGLAPGLAVNPDGPEERQQAAERCVGLWNSGSDADRLWATGLQRQFGRASVSIYTGERGCRLLFGMPETGEVLAAGYDRKADAFAELSGEDLELEKDARESGKYNKAPPGGGTLLGEARIERSGLLRLTAPR